MTDRVCCECEHFTDDYHQGPGGGNCEVHMRPVRSDYEACDKFQFDGTVVVIKKSEA